MLANDLFACSNPSIFTFACSVCCLYKMKLGTRRTAERTSNVLNNGLTRVVLPCYVYLVSRMRLAIALNLEGKSCVINNQCTVGPGACVHDSAPITVEQLQDIRLGIESTASGLCRRCAR